MTVQRGLTGAGTALVTPFTNSGGGGQIDEKALRAFVDWQIEQGINFVVPCGSTGEAATMTPEEHRRVVEITVEQTNGRVPVVAGAGSNDTKKAISFSKEMKAAGATHLLHVSPMYNKPPQRGIVAHFLKIAEATDLPIILYNVPGRTGSNMEAQTTLELAKHPNIVSVKEASANMAQIDEIIRNAPKDFTILSGDDPLTVEIMAHGGHGVISVTSNVAPRLVTELTSLAASGDLEGARKIDTLLSPWTKAAFIESNPIPAKAALAMMGKIQNNFRLPMVPMDPKYNDTVKDALKHIGAI